MKETSKITYDFGKLKRFLTLIRLIMQDVLLTLTKRCYYEFYDFIASFVPDEVIVESSNKVINKYSTDPKKTVRKRPLFNIDLIKSFNE